MRYVIEEKEEDCVKAFQSLAKKKGFNLTAKGNKLSIAKDDLDKFSKAFDDILDDFHKENDCDISWDQDNDGDIEFSEKKKKESLNAIVLDGSYLIEGKIYPKNTTFYVKEIKESEEDILLEKDIKVNDSILTKGEVLSLTERVFKEDHLKDIARDFLMKIDSAYESMYPSVDADMSDEEGIEYIQRELRRLFSYVSEKSGYTAVSDYFKVLIRKI